MPNLPLPGGDRGGKDAHPTFAVDRLGRGHRRRSETQHVERAGEVGAHDGLEGLEGARGAVPVHDTQRAVAAGTVHEDSQGTTCARDVDCRGDGIRVRDVGRRVEGAGGLYGFRGAREVDADHGGPARHEPDRGCSAETRACARHDRDGVVDLHGAPWGLATAGLAA